MTSRRPWPPRWQGSSTRPDVACIAGSERRIAVAGIGSLDIQLPPRQRRVRAGRSSSLVRAALRFACPAVRGLVARRRTYFAHCVRCIQTAATRQSLKRAARAATSPGLAGRAGPAGPAVRKAQTVHRTVCVRAHLLGAPEARHVLHTPAFADSAVVFGRNTTQRAARRAVPGRGDLWGGEERSAEVGARSAIRDLTRRGCLSAAPEGRVASSATRPWRDAVRPDMEQSPADCSVPRARPCAC